MSQDRQLLEQMAQDGRGWVRERAEMAIILHDQFTSGGLDESEYQELMMDLVRSDRLDAEADDLDTKTMLVTAIYGVAQVI
jgi:hypothetical protein